VCVADRGGIADPEERGQVQGIRPVGQGFLEVAIHAEPIERDAAVPKESLRWVLLMGCRP
jgi:hypothetical protein